MPEAQHIALVGRDRQLWVACTDGAPLRQLTSPVGPDSGMSWGVPTRPRVSEWPTWSPDARWIACFRTLEEDESTDPIVVAVSVDGDEERHLVELPQQLPMYLSWSPDGRRLAVLTQDQDEVELGVTSLDRLGAYRALERGAPLHFAWASPDRVVVHVAGSAGRIVSRDVAHDSADEVLREAPGAFAAPLAVGDRQVFVVRRGGFGAVCVGTVEGGPEREIAALDGLVAAIPSPDGRHVACSSSGGGPGGYRGVSVVSLEGSPPRRVFPDLCLAFLWLPGSDGLLVVTMDGNALRWNLVRLDPVEVVPLLTFWPSREQLFLLHFFEQYAQSHALVSPDGESLVFAGHRDPRRALGECLIHTLDLRQPGRPPEVVAEGSFAVFNPTPHALAEGVMRSRHAGHGATHHSNG